MNSRGPNSLAERGGLGKGARLRRLQVFDCGDVQEGAKDVPILAGEGDEQPALHDHHEIGAANIVRIAAAHPDAERLERVAFEQASTIVGVHASIISRYASLWQVWSRTLGGDRL